MNCTTCRLVASGLRDVLNRFEQQRIVTVLQAHNHDEAVEMVAAVGLAGDEVVVDLENEYGEALGIDLRPVAVVVRDGIVSEGATIRNAHQLRSCSRDLSPAKKTDLCRSSPRFDFDHWRCQVTLYDRFEKLSESDMTTTTRRRLLARAAKASLGVAIVAAGLSRTGSAAAAKAALGCCSLAYKNHARTARAMATTAAAAVPGGPGTASTTPTASGSAASATRAGTAARLLVRDNRTVLKASRS